MPSRLPSVRLPLLLLPLLLLPLLLLACPTPPEDCDGCLIGDTCRPHGEVDADNGCRRCDSVLNPAGWTDDDGRACDDDVFCNGADTCAAGACTVHAGAPCGEGQFCNESDKLCGVECGGCLIDGVCVLEGQANPANPCEVCATASSAQAWSPDDGATCDDDVFCNGADSCADGACTVHAGEPCGEGFTCDDVDDACVNPCAGCLVDGACVLDGAANPTNPCEVCAAALTQLGWSPDDDATCDDGLFCTGVETCSDGTCASTDACTPTETCYEDEDQCCTPSVALACGTGDDVYEVDSCGRQGALVQQCDACIDGRCLCDPVAQTGCLVGEKCSFADGITACVPDGDRPLDASCTTPVSGPDDCVAGTFCIDGECAEVCASAPDTCPEAARCTTYAGLFSDTVGVGLCIAQCDPVQQDCAIGEGCYLQSVTSDTSCAGVPTDALGVVQGDACYGPASGGCFLNGCDVGYGANLPPDVCAFFCNPIDNWQGNINGLAGDPAGIGCDEVFGGARPDGPGAGYECRYLQTFYSNTEAVLPTIGMCVPTADHGTCADYDYVQYLSDLADGTAEEQDYCTNNPERCMASCVSLATLNP